MSARACLIIRLIPIQSVVQGECATASINDATPGRALYVTPTACLPTYGTLAVTSAAVHATPTSLDTSACGTPSVIDKPYVLDAGNKNGCTTARLKVTVAPTPTNCPLTVKLPAVPLQIVVRNGNAGYHIGHVTLTQSLTSRIPLEGVDSLVLGGLVVLSGTVYVYPERLYPPPIGKFRIYLAKQRIILQSVGGAQQLSAPIIYKRNEVITLPSVGDSSYVEGVFITLVDQVVTFVGVGNGSEVPSVTLENKDKDVYPVAINSAAFGDFTLWDNFQHVTDAGAIIRDGYGAPLVYNLLTIVNPQTASFVRVGIPTLSNYVRRIELVSVDSCAISPFTIHYGNTLLVVGTDASTYGTPTVWNRRSYVYAGDFHQYVTSPITVELADRRVYPDPLYDSFVPSIQITLVTRPYIAGIDNAYIGSVTIHNDTIHNDTSIVAPTGYDYDYVHVSDVYLRNKLYWVYPDSHDYSTAGAFDILNADAFTTLEGVDTSCFGDLDCSLRAQEIRLGTTLNTPEFGTPEISYFDRYVAPNNITALRPSRVTISMYLQVIDCSGSVRDNLNVEWYLNGVHGMYTVTNVTSGVSSVSPLTVAPQSTPSELIGPKEDWMRIGVPTVYPPGVQTVRPDAATTLDEATDVYILVATGMEWYEFPDGWGWKEVMGDSVRLDAIPSPSVALYPIPVFTQTIRLDAADDIGTIVMYVSVNLEGGDVTTIFGRDVISPVSIDSVVVDGDNFDSGYLDVDRNTGKVIIIPPEVGEVQVDRGGETQIPISKGRYGIQYPIVTSTHFTQYTSYSYSEFGNPSLVNRNTTVHVKGAQGWIQPELNLLRATQFRGGVRTPGNKVEWRDINGTYMWDVVTDLMWEGTPDYIPQQRFDSQFGRLSITPTKFFVYGSDTEVVGSFTIGDKTHRVLLDGAHSESIIDYELVGYPGMVVRNSNDGKPHIIYVNYGIPSPNLLDVFISGGSPPAVALTGVQSVRIAAVSVSLRNRPIHMRPINRNTIGVPDVHQ